MKNKFFNKALSVFTAMAMALSLMTGIPFSELGLGITVSANDASSTTECTCGTDDPAFHATNCPAYIAPENPQCTCAEKCTDDTLNVWCDVCGVQGVSVCQGEDTAVIYEEQTTGDFTVTGGTYGQDYTYDSEARLLTIKSSTEITIANTAPEIATEDMIFVEDGVNADIILAGVNINVGSSDGDIYDCPLRIADDSTGDVTITIKDETINTLTSYVACAGIQKTGDANTGTLTIRGGSEGSGVLNATGGESGAGIGGGYERDGICANIKIENAIVNATGGSEGGAGIGAGSGDSGSALATNIQIINSTVTATGNYASGIGGGYLGEASNITICGGSVKAVVNSGRAYGIGSGTDKGVVIPTNGTENVYLLKIENPEGKTVYIDGNAYSHNSHNEENTVYAYVTGESHTVKLVGDGENVDEVEGTTYHFYPTIEGTFVAEDTVMDTVSDFDITGGTAGVDYLYVAEEKNLYLLTDTALIISNKQDVETATTKIETGMNCNINVTFAGVNIDVSDTTGACAFKIPDNSTGTVIITLADNSTNTLKSGYLCAGIQKNGDAGTLMIQGENSGNGVLNATGKTSGAGIGGGKLGNASNITINNATVTANGGTDGAGIGGGSFGNASNITINNATVTATGGASGAGIGGGCGGIGNNITINNATVTANSYTHGAGIGGGENGIGSNIAITGGSVKAEGTQANAIGGGRGCTAVTPTDSLGAGAKNVYLLVIENPDGEEIKIDGVTYNCKAHQEETYVYAYLTGKEHTVEVGEDETEYFFIDGTFVKKSELVLTDAMDFSIEGGSYGTDYLYDSTGNVLYILNDTKLTIQNKEDVAVADTTIVTGVDCDANIVLAGVNIDVSGYNGACAFKIPDNSTGTVTITLKDGTTNTLSSGHNFAGVQKNGDVGTLIIQGENSGTGVLNALGGQYGAGIGSSEMNNVCNITISNAIVNARNYQYGAGIGSAGAGDARNITIRNAVVTAYNDGGGYGIGGSDDTRCYIEKIAIYNSSVKAYDYSGTRKIGGGNNSVTPTASLEDGAANVYVYEINDTQGKSIKINGKIFPDNHLGDYNLYVYLPAAPANEVTIDGVTTKYCYDTTNQKWVPAIDIPEEPEETTFTYDGEAKTYVLLENDTYYTITGNVQTNAGNYTVTVSLKDKENTIWSDGTTEDKEYRFVINKAAVTVTAKSYTIKVGEALPAFEYDVTGLVGGETLPIDVTISCNAADSNTAGTYDIIVSGAAASDNYTFSYIKGTLIVSEKEVVATPTFTPASGTTFTSSQKVTISCATAGAKIYYTTDGTEPTTASTLYNGAFTITTTTTIKAIAVKDGMTDSAVASITFTKNEYRPPVYPSYPIVTTTTTTTTTTTPAPVDDDEIIDEDIDDDSDDEDIEIDEDTDTTKPVDDGDEPQIKGEDDKTGWDVIADEIADADDGDKIVVDMNGTTEVPEDILEQIQGQDIDLVIELDNGFTWTINGESVTEPMDIDLGVNEGATIPVKVINSVTDECEYITLTLSHNGEFGFTAVLTVDMGDENEGYFANLYWYTDNDTKFICADKIDNNGRANLVFTHASEYVIVIDENDHTPEDDDVNPFTAVTISFTGVIISAATIMIARKRKKQ